jgi:hypothetical protein
MNGNLELVAKLFRQASIDFGKARKRSTSRYVIQVLALIAARFSSRQRAPYIYIYIISPQKLYTADGLLQSAVTRSLCDELGNRWRHNCAASDWPLAHDVLAGGCGRQSSHLHYDVTLLEYETVRWCRLYVVTKSRRMVQSQLPELKLFAKKLSSAWQKCNIKAVWIRSADLSAFKCIQTNEIFEIFWTRWQNSDHPVAECWIPISHRPPSGTALDPNKSQTSQRRTLCFNMRLINRRFKR